MARSDYYLFKKTKSEFLENTEFLQYENLPNEKEIIKLFEETAIKVDFKKKLNDNNRYLLINFTSLLKNQELKDYYINNKVVVLSSNPDEAIFQHNKKPYKPNLSIKPDKDIVNSLRSIICNGYDSEFKDFLSYCKNENLDNHEDFMKGNSQELFNTISSSYISGGVRGGNCWGLDHQHQFSESAPSDYNKFGFLFTIFEKFKPDISFLESEKIKRDLQEVFCDTEELESIGYYGDYYEYHVDYIKIKEVYDVLKKYDFNLSPEREEKLENKEEQSNNRKNKIK